MWNKKGTVVKKLIDYKEKFVTMAHNRKTDIIQCSNQYNQYWLNIIYHKWKKF